MANQKTEGMDEAVRLQMLYLLRERVHNPTKMWDSDNNTPNPEYHAGRLLKRAEYFDREGLITIAGMDYHRRETTRFRRARENWFPVTVVVVAVLAAVCGPFFDFLWAIVLP